MFSERPKVFLSGSLQSGLTVKKGGEIRLDACISGSPYPTVSWYWNNGYIEPVAKKKRPEKPKKKIDTDVSAEPEEPSYPSLPERLSIDMSRKGESTALVHDCVRRDHGKYMIKVENDHGVASASCEVNVLGK